MTAVSEFFAVVYGRYEAMSGLTMCSMHTASVGPQAQHRGKSAPKTEISVTLLDVRVVSFGHSPRIPGLVYGDTRDLGLINVNDTKRVSKSSLVSFPA